MGPISTHCLAAFASGQPSLLSGVLMGHAFGMGSVPAYAGNLLSRCFI
jgi:hypothetical protein